MTSFLSEVSVRHHVVLSRSVNNSTTSLLTELKVASMLAESSFVEPVDYSS